jgi:DNA-binding NtrC family response regulator
LDLLSTSGAAIDILLTDESMPLMTGSELIKEVRQTRPSLKVLLMSGYGGHHAVDSSGEEPLFIDKPFSSNKLVSLIEQLLSRRGA